MMGVCCQLESARGAMRSGTVRDPDPRSLAYDRCFLSSGAGPHCPHISTLTGCEMLEETAVDRVPSVRCQAATVKHFDLDR